MIHFVSIKKKLAQLFLKSTLLSLIFLILLSVMTGFIARNVMADSHPAKQLFQDNCSACHTVGSGRLVGPDLSGVNNRHSEKWLKSFIKSSQSMVNSGDTQAVELFKKYNNIPMPDAVISEQQIGEILQYLKATTLLSVNENNGNKLKQIKPEKILSTDESSTTRGQAVDNKIADAQASDGLVSEEQILTGQNIFQGVVRLENGGPACNGCHDVRNDLVIGGGILARELTSVFSRMGGSAVRSILGSAPFPVMKTAYLDKPLTKDEITALVAFFQHTDQLRAYQQPRDYGTGLFISGLFGVGFLLIFYSLLWSRRKKNSVNQSIYDRQIKSS